MKAITICQPYAHLITLPESHQCHKRIENRTWKTNYRGPLLIHAGKSRKFMFADTLDEFQIRGETLAYGAIVARAELICCVHVSDTYRPYGLPDDLQWVRWHMHTEGPYCWILANIQPLAVPIPCNGAQGLWEHAWDDTFPWSICPACGAIQKDLDGFGVMYCPRCKFCEHPSSDDGMCSLCRKEIRLK